MLDIGCGNGVVGEALAKYFGFKIVGTDILSYAQDANIPFVPMTADAKLDFPDKSFDVGMFNDVLHHVPAEVQIELIKEALRVCKRVLIFEVKPTWIAKKLDYLINQIHNPNMPILLTHREETDWMALFKQHDIQASYDSVNKPYPGYPFTNYLFILQ